MIFPNPIEVLNWARDRFQSKVELLAESLRDGRSCGHPGCLNHTTHPCEQCDRIQGFKYHKEMIKCDECGCVQTAFVLHTTPFNSYVHQCDDCHEWIMESNWNNVD